MDIFFTLLIQPLLNLLIIFYNLPIIGFGGAIILLTLLIKLLFFPFSLKFIKFRIKFQGIQPKMKEIQKKYKDNSQILTQKTLELFKKEKVNPFIGFLSFLIQVPIMIAMFFLLKNTIDLTGLYNFIYYPEDIYPIFFGINLLYSSFVLAGVAAITQFIFGKVMQSFNKKIKNKKEANFMKFFEKYIVYIFPLVTFFVALIFPAALALYWIINTLASTAEHLYFNHTYKPSLDNE